MRDLYTLSFSNLIVQTVYQNFSSFFLLFFCPPPPPPPTKGSIFALTSRIEQPPFALFNFPISHAKTPKEMKTTMLPVTQGQAALYAYSTTTALQPRHSERVVICVAGLWRETVAAMTQIYTVHVHCAMLSRRDSPRLFGEPLDPTPGRPSQVSLLDCFRYDFYLAFALSLSEIGSCTLRCVVRVCCGWLVRAMALKVSLTSKFVSFQ